MCIRDRIKHARQTHNAGEDPLCNCRHFIFTNAGCSFSFHGLDDVVFVGVAGVNINRMLSAFIVILLVACGALWMATDHYRDNAITYKAQRDNKASELKLANATITDMQVRQRDVAALDAKYSRELALSLIHISPSSVTPLPVRLHHAPETRCGFPVYSVAGPYLP